MRRWQIVVALLLAGVAGCRPGPGPFVLLMPMLRGENGNPGTCESFLGEVDDAIAAGHFVVLDERVRWSGLVRFVWWQR